MQIQDCALDMAVRLKQQCSDSRGRKIQPCGIIQGIDAKGGYVDVGFGFWSRNEHDWRNPSVLEMFPRFERPCRPEGVPPESVDGKLMVVALTPANDVIAVGRCGRVVVKALYRRFAEDYGIPQDVSWGIHGDHRQVAAWLGYRTVQVRAAQSHKTPGTIEFAICYAPEPPHMELEGIWDAEE